MADTWSTRHAKLVAPQNCFMLARIAKCLRDWTPKNLSGRLMGFDFSDIQHGRMRCNYEGEHVCIG